MAVFKLSERELGRGLDQETREPWSFDGSDKWVSVTKFPRFDNEGNVIGSMGISRDITELKKLEAMQLQKVE